MRKAKMLWSAQRATSNILFMRFILIAIVGLKATNLLGQPLKVDPLPSDYVERNAGGATITPPGKMMLDGHRLVCRNAATILDPNLNDYAASYPRFIILNPQLMAKVETPVKLWIYNHECGHVSGIRDESEADCFSIRHGRQDGWLTPQGLDQVCDFISTGRQDARHFSGPDRCAIMRKCYEEPAPKTAR